MLNAVDIQIFNLEEASLETIKEALQSIDKSFPTFCLSPDEMMREIYYEPWDPHHNDTELSRLFHSEEGERALLDICERNGSPRAVLVIRDEWGDERYFSLAEDLNL